MSTPNLATPVGCVAALVVAVCSVLSCGKPSRPDAIGAMPPTCGNGILDSGEECDGGASNGSDESLCGASCERVESLPTECAGCPQTPQCGDGKLAQPTETCDDGNIQDEDGCSATCQLEVEHFCEEQDSPCSAVVFVDDDPTHNGPGDGLTWDTAYRRLDTALNAAGVLLSLSIASDVEVRVAEGKYAPQGDRHGFFKLRSAVAVYGGFVDLETNLETSTDESESLRERDWERYPTILTGDLGEGYSARHIVVADNTDASAVLDGFIIEGGRAVSVPDDAALGPYGAGIIVSSASPIIRNCIFRNNYAENGGAVAVWGPSEAVFENTFFRGNMSLVNGGALYVSGSSARVVLANSFFENNESVLGDGGGILVRGATLTIRDTTMSMNSSHKRGGAIASEDASIFADNVMFGSNGAEYGGALSQRGAHGLCNLMRTSFDNNTATLQGGGASIAGYATVFGSLFVNNFALQDGGAAVIAGAQTDVEIINATLALNETAEGLTGGIYSNGAGDVLVANTIFWRNTSAENESSPQMAHYGVAPQVVASWWPVEDSETQSASQDDVTMFVDPERGDYTLHPNSPAIDAGASELIPSDVGDADKDANTDEPYPFDIAGAVRMCGDAVDLGAHEYQY